MSFLTDYIAVIRDWIDDQDPSDAVITSWIRNGEERMNEELRVTAMVERGSATFDDNCAKLPDDWLEHIYVRLAGGRPFDFITNHDYWDLENPPTTSPAPDPNERPYPWPGKKQLYTTIGDTLFVWPPIDPIALTKIEICYFRKLIPLGDTKDPVFDRHPAIYLNCTLAAGSPYLIEDERLPTWMSAATAGIQKANEAAKKGRFSGSPIAPRIRGFG